MSMMNFSFTEQVEHVSMKKFYNLGVNAKSRISYLDSVFGLAVVSMLGQTEQQMVLF